jgi:tight adherence protein C
MLMNSLIIATVVVAAVLLAGAALVVLALLGARARQEKKLESRVMGRDRISEEFSGAPTSFIQALLGSGEWLEKIIDKDGETGRLLLQAGWRGAQRRNGFYVFRAAVMVAAVILVMLMWALGGGVVKAQFLPLYSFALLAVAFLAPLWTLRSLAAARRARISREVPLFIHLLVLLFEAGLSTRQGFATLVREGRGVLPELGQEFELVLRQLEAGGDISEVLRTLGQTLDIGDLDSVLGVLRQVDRYGGEVREPLMEALKVIEERRGLDLRERVNLTSGRMTVVMVLFFFPALLILVAGPAVLSILRAMSQVAGGK